MALIDAGWRVLVVWECATKAMCANDLVQTTARWLQGTETTAELGVYDHICPGEFNPWNVGNQERQL